MCFEHHSYLSRWVMCSTWDELCASYRRVLYSTWDEFCAPYGWVLDSTVTYPDELCVPYRWVSLVLHIGPCTCGWLDDPWTSQHNMSLNNGGIGRRDKFDGRLFDLKTNLIFQKIEGRIWLFLVNSMTNLDIYSRLNKDNH